MDSNQVSYIVALLFAIAILVILIVILAKYKGEASATYDQDAANAANTKVNWLYYINLVEVGLIVIFGVLGLFAYRRWCMLGGNCMKA